jgi:phosphoribosylformylglycinamidine synthase
MPRVIVDVMLKPEILDPQGKAVGAALARLGYTGIAGVRQGKRFEIEFAADPTAADLDRIAEAAASLLSNPVIEDVVAIRTEAGR